MYRCQQCGDQVPKGTSRQVIVVRQPWHHPHRRGANKKFVFEKGKMQEKWVDDPGGHGTQITAEISVCLKCMALYNQKLQAAGSK